MRVKYIRKVKLYDGCMRYIWQFYKTNIVIIGDCLTGSNAMYILDHIFQLLGHGIVWNINLCLTMHFLQTLFDFVAELFILQLSFFQRRLADNFVCWGLAQSMRIIYTILRVKWCNVWVVHWVVYTFNRMHTFTFITAAVITVVVISTTALIMVIVSCRDRKRRVVQGRR